MPQLLQGKMEPMPTLRVTRVRGPSDDDKTSPDISVRLFVDVVGCTHDTIPAFSSVCHFVDGFLSRFKVCYVLVFALSLL